jgi:hypothetical protein
MPTGRHRTAAALLLLGAVPAAACSPPRRSETEEVQSGSDQLLARFSLGPEARSRELDRPEACAGRDLSVTILDRSRGGAKSIAYLLTVEALGAGSPRRVLAHTPYPVGSDVRLTLPGEACAADRLRFAVHPVEGEALAAGTRIDIAVSAAAAPRD